MWLNCRRGRCLSRFPAADPLAGEAAPPGAVVTVECDKQESGEVRRRLFKPASDDRAPRRQSGAVRGLEPRDPASRRGGGANDQQPADRPDRPVAISHDVACESSLPIKPMKRRLRVGDDGFDLDDQQGAMRRVKREDVDRTALTPNRERDLDVRDPAAPSQSREEGVDQAGMSLVDEAVQLFATPPKANVSVIAQMTRLVTVDRRDQRPR